MNALTPTTQKALTARAVDEARDSLLVLFAAYDPPFSDRNADKAGALMDAKVRAYLLGLGKLPGWAVEEGVRSIIEGRVERPSRRIGVLPTVEELATEARKHVEREAARQHSAQQFHNRTIERVPFMERIERKRRQFAHRAVLFENVNYDQFRQLSRSGQIPVGGQWVASLGTVYGPEPKSA